ncbi:hypothetical protein E2P81_ATG03978 [Venturia nashicola]|nr:hypothetical protein E2P81_ATG03978 [Venturia nashicola]
MSYLELPQDSNITPDWNPYKMTPSNIFALETPYSNPHKTASQNMSALDKLSKRLTSMPMSQAPPRERKKFYTPHEVTTDEDVWKLLYRQARGSLPMITSRSAVEDIRKASLYPMASLEQLTWLGKLEIGDHSIIHKVPIMLEYIAGMVDTSSDSQNTLQLHEELVGIINICRGINHYSHKPDFEARDKVLTTFLTRFRFIASCNV